LTVQLLLVRHATTAQVGHRLTGRGDGVPLSPEGEREARRLALRLAGTALDEVLTSPRERARATATALAGATRAPLREEPALDEIDFGDWTGRVFADLDGDPAWDAWNGRRGEARVPGGESMAEAAARAAALVTDLAQARSGRIALVSHCDVIRGLVATLLGLPLDNLLRFDVAPASVTRLEAGPGWSRLITLNDTAHLDAA
jgi:ribonuclease H / adenosylcobalamin/alpha-ribazole phosphatase